MKPHSIFPGSEFGETASLPGSPTAPPSGRQSPTDQRQTILSLVELLLKQNEEVGGSRNHFLSHEDDKDIPVFDDSIQVAGAEVFHILQKRINNLDRELRNFANAARQLGSSAAILSSAYHLRERLAQLLFLYHENAANLFPKKVSHIAKDAESPTSRRRRGLRPVTGKAQLHLPRPAVSENLDLENFPEQLEQLAEEVTNFLRCLNEFPEFTDEVVNSSIMGFEGDLRYWASCLKEYTGQFRSPAVQRYIHELSADMGDHLEELTSSLSMFTEVGVPTIRFAQEHGADNLLNLSTVATFFSAVTATTMQFSYDLPRNKISDAVNCFWFASMVFSIAASVNSLLGLTWKQAMYRSPGHRVPWWVLIWIKRSPLVFLVLSVACFSIGFCCFTYASRQAHVTSTLTTVLTAFTSFGLAAVSAWFASERWAFARHRGQKWLNDILSDSFRQFMALPLVSWSSTVVMAGFRHVGSLSASLFQVFKSLYTSCTTCCRRKPHRRDNDPEVFDTVPRSTMSLDNHSEELRPLPRRQASDATTATKVSEPPNFPYVQAPVDKEATIVEPSTSTVGKQLWRKAIRSVKVQNAVLEEKAGGESPPFAVFGNTISDSPQLDVTGGSHSGLASPVRKRTTSSSGIGWNTLYERQKNMGDVSVFGRSRVNTIVPKLSELGVKYDLVVHSALVRHMQFSPDGKYLATSSWDRTSVIFKVGSPYTLHCTLAHPQGFVGQVAWSPSGKVLLTKMARGIKVWIAEDGVCKRTIPRNTSIESIAWCPNGEAFLSIEDSTVFKLDLTGRVLAQYEFSNLKLHEVAITPDSVRFVGVGPLLRSPTGLHPCRSRGEKRIVVYNMETKQLENQAPILDDVRDVAIAQTSKGAFIALVSYEYKAPPQLWKLEVVKDKDNSVTSKLSLRRTYIPKAPVDFAGRSHFAGKNNELVLSYGRNGDIHFWDQESGSLVHIIRAHAHGNDLTCMAWNRAVEDPYMFATGSHDGTIRIWTRTPPPDDVLDHEELAQMNMPEFPRSSSPITIEME